MFDAAELGQSVPDDEFKSREKDLRLRLLLLQREIRKRARFPVILDFAGVDGAGKVSTVNMLNTWMDPRWMRTIGFQPPTDRERAFPRLHRFWNHLPKKGRMGLYVSGRYSDPLLQRVNGDLNAQEFDAHLSGIKRFETALADDGALLLKFWMQLSKAQQKERLDSLSADPLRAYEVTEQHRNNHERYAQFVEAAEQLITRTNNAHAPWHIVEGVDANFRHLAVGELLADAIERHLEQDEARAKSRAPRRRSAETGLPTTTVFKALDLTKSVEKPAYTTLLSEKQSVLGQLGRAAQQRGQSTVLVFEGPDASGKGGAIRRIVWSLDARSTRVHRFAAPTDEQSRFHYLWRFWQRLPEAGNVAVFDRSWYGRVLVERVEGFATEDEWRRAYSEINDFEQQIVEQGTVLLKFWMHIDKDEQLRRFRNRESSVHKRWKLTEEDWRNRDVWDSYERCAHDMLQFTSTQKAPWIVVEANDKRYARLKVLDTVIEHLQKRVKD